LDHAIYASETGWLLLQWIYQRCFFSMQILPENLVTCFRTFWAVARGKMHFIQRS
jgi:hypothetical protein